MEDKRNDVPIELVKERVIHCVRQYNMALIGPMPSRSIWLVGLDYKEVWVVSLTFLLSTPSTPALFFTSAIVAIALKRILEQERGTGDKASAIWNDPIGAAISAHYTGETFVNRIPLLPLTHTIPTLCQEVLDSTTTCDEPLGVGIIRRLYELSLKDREAPTPSRRPVQDLYERRRLDWMSLFTTGAIVLMALLMIFVAWRYQPVMY